MSSAGFTKRRGLRAIVSRGATIGTRIELHLECGHTVTKSAKGHRGTTKSAVCRACAKADGEARDKAKAEAA